MAEPIDVEKEALTITSTANPRPCFCARCAEQFLNVILARHTRWIADRLLLRRQDAEWLDQIADKLERGEGV